MTKMADTVNVLRGALEKAVAVIQHLDPSLQDVGEVSFRALVGSLAAAPKADGMDAYTRPDTVDAIKAPKAVNVPREAVEEFRKWYELDRGRAILKGKARKIVARILAAAAPKAEPEISCDVPAINIKCEVDVGAAIGTTSLNVIRVDKEDDGSLTAVTDHWPAASPKVEQEPINSALAAYGALWLMVTDNPTLHAARKHLLASIGGQGSKAQRLAITWAVRNVAHPTDAEIAAMDFHPAPASDELLEALEGVRKALIPCGVLNDSVRKALTIADRAIAKHKGAQS